MSEPEPVAEIENPHRFRFRLHDDWTWSRAPGPDPPGDWRGYPDRLLAGLRKLGRHEEGVPTLHDTALAGASLVRGRVVRWWGGHDDPEKEHAARRREWEEAAARGEFPTVP